MTKELNDAFWREAILDECTLTNTPFHEVQPRKTLHDLIQWHVHTALDPKVSEAAQELINRGYKVGVVEMSKEMSVSTAGAVLTRCCYNASAAAAGWWGTDPVRAISNPLAFSNKLCLIHSEISEAMEGDRKNLMDDHLPHRQMREVELADAVIRIFDLAGAYSMDLGGAIAEKMAYNAQRADHKPEARADTNGKKY